MPAPDMIDIRNWRTDTGREPVVRVGIVLDEDARSNLELGIPQEDYRLTAQGGPGEVRHAMPVVARLTGGAVAVRAGDEAERVASVWHIAPVRAQSRQHGQGILVRNLVVGRGFHWQKRVDQTLCGRIELHAGRRGLIVVNELPLERYLAGVITAEMSGRCPGDFLRAQCVVARSWLLAFTEAKHEDDPFDRCNDDCCQRYQGTGDLTAAAIEAVASTRGLALVDADGNVVDANYSKCCGGITESPEHVWDRSKPGLSAVADMPPDSPARRFFPLTEDKLDEYLDGEWLREPAVYCSPNAVPQDRLATYLGRVDEGGRYFRWTVTHRREELEALLRAGLEQTSDLVRLWDLKVVERGVSGRAGEIACARPTPRPRRSHRA